MAPGDDVPDLDYICLTKGNFEILLRELLLVKSYRVEVFTKVNGFFFALSIDIYIVYILIFDHL